MPGNSKSLYLRGSRPRPPPLPISRPSDLYRPKKTQEHTHTHDVLKYNISKHPRSADVAAKRALVLARQVGVETVRLCLSMHAYLYEGLAELPGHLAGGDWRHLPNTHAKLLVHTTRAYHKHRSRKPHDQRQIEQRKATGAQNVAY